MDAPVQDKQDVLNKVAPFLGNAYVWGGKGPDQGFDCSGLAGYLTTGQPESTVTLYGKSAAISQDQAQAGDLVFWNMGSSDPHMQHVGVYLGDGRVVQSGGTQSKVNIGNINQAIGSAPEFRRIGGSDTSGGVPVQAAAPPGAPTPDQSPEAIAQPVKQTADETISNPFGEAFRQLGAVKDQVGGAIGGAASGLGTTVNTAFSSPLAQSVQAGQEAQTRGTVQAAEGVGNFLTEEQPWMRNVVQGGLRQSQAIAAGEDPGKALTPQEQYAMARGMATGLSQTVVPEELIARGATAGAGSLSRSGQIAEDLARARQRGEGINPFDAPPIRGETTPPSVTGPRVARMAGTAAEQAAVGAPEEGRAANILLEKFPEEVRPHLQDVATRFGQFAGQRRGVISDDQALKNAAEVALGTTPEKWIKTPAGKAFNQEQAIALGDTLAQVGKEYDGLLAEVIDLRTAGKITPEKEAELADKTLEFAALAGVRSGAAAEAGRALRAFRQALNGEGYANRNKAIDAAFKAIGGDKEKFAQWVEEFSKIPANDPVARYQMLQGLQTPSWWDRVSLLRYASMLSSTTTHMVNAFGNVINVGLDVALKPVSVGIDVTRARITGGERTRFMGEVAPQIQGLLDGATAGFWDGLTTLKTGVNPQDAGKFENIRSGFQAGRGTTSIMGTAGGGVTGGLTAPEDATLQERAARILAGAAGGAAIGAGVGSSALGRNIVNTAVEAPLRGLTFSDLIFRGAARGSQVRAIAAREGIKQGLTGAALRAHIDDVVKNIVQHPDIMAEADQAAARAVLQEPNQLASAVTSFGRGPGADNVAKRIVREIILPFAKTPANILNQGLEMTPYGLLKTARLAKAGETGAATDAAARVAFGGALMVGVGAMAANGLVTGGYPADSKDRATLPPGWQPWSLRLPNGDGGHNYVSFSQLGPVAIPMAIAAVVGNSLRGENLIADPVNLGASLGKFMIDQTFLQGLSAIVDAVKDPKRYGENVTEQIATSFVPYSALAREVTRITGQADRDPKGVIEAIQALIPGVAENVPRRQDALGRDIHSVQTGVGAALSPARYSSTQAEPLMTAFRDIGEGIPNAPPEIRITSKLTGSTTPPIKLTEREQDAYQRIFGQKLMDIRGSQVASPDWQKRTLASRKASLDAAVKIAREFAENQVYAQMAPDDRTRRMQEGRARLQQIKPLPAP